MRIRPGLWPTSAGRLAWRLLQLLATLTLIWGAWRLLGHTPYRIDIDVYRMGGRCWLDGRPLYSGDTSFHTQAGADLPFTYPPLSAIVFAPFAMLSLPAASATITAGSPLHETLYLRIYQMSEAVGRGYAAQVTLP